MRSHWSARPRVSVVCPCSVDLTPQWPAHARASNAALAPPAMSRAPPLARRSAKAARAAPRSADTVRSADDMFPVCCNIEALQCANRVLSTLGRRALKQITFPLVTSCAVLSIDFEYRVGRRSCSCELGAGRSAHNFRWAMMTILEDSGSRSGLWAVHGGPQLQSKPDSQPCER
jgi:hypothetical protein